MTTIVPCTFFIGQVSALCSCSCYLHAVKLQHRQVAWISNCAILWMQPLEMHDAQSFVEGGQSSSWSPETVFMRGDKMTSTYTAATYWFMVCAEQLTKASISRIYWKWQQLQNRICRVSCLVQLDAEVSICLVTGTLLSICHIQTINMYKIERDHSHNWEAGCRMDTNSFNLFPVASGSGKQTDFW